MDHELKQMIATRVGQELSELKTLNDDSFRHLAAEGMGHSWLIKVMKGEIRMKLESFFNICIALKIKPSEVLARFEQDVIDEYNKK